MRIKKPLSLGHGHVETILPFFIRRPKKLNFKRERIETEDHDFLDLDWLTNENNSLVILSHGLEGSSNAQYITGMAKYLHKNNFDILAWNNRSCSGEVNRTLKYYHSGASYDLGAVIEHAINNANYENIYLIGFSLGGNQTLKYLGEKPHSLSPVIKGACVFSTPCCLEASSEKLRRGFSKVYTKMFLESLTQKVQAKKEKLTKFGIDPSKVYSLRSLPEFDDHYTAPLHGFKDAKDYYKKSSSKFFIKDIKVPTLIVNAKNDPFLAGECFPYKEVEKNPLVTLEVPENGGHVGFLQLSKTGILWSEQRAYHFLKSLF